MSVLTVQIDLQDESSMRAAFNVFIRLYNIERVTFAGDQPAQTDTAAPAPAAPAPAGDGLTVSGPMDYDTFRESVNTVLQQKGGMEAVRAVLAEYGISRLTEVPEVERAAFIHKLPPVAEGQ